jgi:hypothetical protein
MDKITRNFLWIGSNAEGIQDRGELKGVSLLEAIINEFKSSGSCIYWDDKCCEDWASLSVEDKAKQILWHIEESFVEGTSSNQISVIDITDPNNTIMVFPIDKRTNNFNINLVGLRYQIKVWIPTECEDPQIFESMESAVNELEQLQLMQPENRYEIHEVDFDE